MNPDEITGALGRPLTVNKLNLSHRMIMGPMAVNAPNPDGSVSEQTIAFLEARARGGASMIIIGGFVTARRQYEERTAKCLRFDDDRFLPGVTRLAERIHAHGVPLIAEIMPGFGRMGSPYKGRQIISASPMRLVLPEDGLPAGFRGSGGMRRSMPREATITEIKEHEEEMIAAADRLARAGLDGVEVAFTMSYLGASFLSPRTNWRTDEYGGSTENRARFLAETVMGIRRRVGPDFLIGVRLAADDFLPDGQGPDEYAAIAKLAEGADADYIAIASGNYETLGRIVPDAESIDLGHARIFKQRLSIPLFVTGIHDPAKSAKAIADGEMDAVLLARPLLADPEYPNKVLRSRFGQIVYCDRVNNCGECAMRMMLHIPVRCRVNPAAGRESGGGRVGPLERVIHAPAQRMMLKALESRALVKLALPLIQQD